MGSAASQTDECADSWRGMLFRVIGSRQARRCALGAHGGVGARVQLLEHFLRTTRGLQLLESRRSYLIGLGPRRRPSGLATPLTLAHHQPPRSLVVYLPQNLCDARPLGAMRAQQTVAKRDELGICAQVSLRYEMPYLLSWVAYHTLRGFDRILASTSTH